MRRQAVEAESNGTVIALSKNAPYALVIGGGNFEDVSAMDTEANDSVLAIVTRVGDDIVVYRRFYHGN